MAVKMWVKLLWCQENFSNERGYSTLSEETVQLVTRQEDESEGEEKSVDEPAVQTHHGVCQLFYMYTVGRKTARLWSSLYSSALSSPAKGSEQMRNSPKTTVYN